MEEEVKNIQNMNNHIMFSYSWNQKSQVRHIYDLIDGEFQGVNKWIDVNKMCGNILVEMNDAVENSFVIIIFVSKDYKNSKNCKTEAELIFGKQKKFILVLVEKGFPYLDEVDENNWMSKMFKNQFYIDLTEMDSENLNKLKELIKDNCNEYYGNNSFIRGSQRRPSFSIKKKESPTSLFGSPIKTSISTLKDKKNSKELDEFVLNNNLDQGDIDSIKELVVKTPRTMVPALKASGISFKSILSIIEDIKNEEIDNVSSYFS
tara:strand:+ start:7415 stop:8200 length:786 start_codon:yes stop_codon:yes gene_type:complete